MTHVSGEIFTSVREFNTLELIFCVEFLIILLRETLKSSILLMTSVHPPPLPPPQPRFKKIRMSDKSWKPRTPFHSVTPQLSHSHTLSKISHLLTLNMLINFCHFLTLALFQSLIHRSVTIFVKTISKELTSEMFLAVRRQPYKS